MIQLAHSLKRNTLFAAAALLLAAPAFADTLTFTLASPNQTAAAGSTVSFNGTVNFFTTTPGGVLIDDAFTTTSPTTLTDDGYFNSIGSTPQSSESINTLLFTIFLPGGLSAGTYGGTFTLYEDGDSSVTSTQNYQVTVPGTVAATPEPSSWLLLATGIACTTAFALYRHQSAPLR